MSCAPKLPEILSAAPPERSARRVRLALEYVAVVGGIVAYLEISAVFDARAHDLSAEHVTHWGSVEKA